MPTISKFVTSFKSSIQYNVHFVNFSPIWSKIDALATVFMLSKELCKLFLKSPALLLTSC